MCVLVCVCVWPCVCWVTQPIAVRCRMWLSVPFAKYANSPTPVCIRRGKHTPPHQALALTLPHSTRAVDKNWFVSFVRGCSNSWTRRGTACVSPSFNVCMSFQNKEQASSVKQAHNSLLFFFFLLFNSDGAHDGDDVGGRTGGVWPQCPTDLWRVRRQGHWLPFQCHDVRRLQGFLQVGVDPEFYTRFCLVWVFFGVFKCCLLMGLN